MEKTSKHIGRKISGLRLVNGATFGQRRAGARAHISSDGAIFLYTVKPAPDTRAHPSLSLSLLFSFIFGSNNCFVFTRQMCVAYVCRVLYSESLVALRPNMEMREGIILNFNKRTSRTGCRQMTEIESPYDDPDQK